MAKKRKASEAYGDAPKPGKMDAKSRNNIKWEKTNRRNDPERQEIRVKRLKYDGKFRKQSLIFAPRPDWHAAKLPELPISENPATPPKATLEALRQHGASLLENDNAQYTATVLSHSSSHKFMSSIMSSGTLEDRVSALTLVAQESPLHTMKALDNLVALARKNNRNQALMALSALKDLLGQGVVLPPDRKLRPFDRQPGLLGALHGQLTWRRGDPLPQDIQEVHLVSWAYEDWLKHMYFEILKITESWCNDEVEYTRSRAVTHVFELLKEKPEQEENLLRLLINKLGDTEKKVASRASYLLLQLQLTHPMMKEVVIGAIESDLLFRPGQRLHAKYYAVTTLNQTILSGREQKVANKLLEIYFSLFMGLLKDKERNGSSTGSVESKSQRGGSQLGKKARQRARVQEELNKSEEDLEERLIAQLLSGVNRAFPYAQTDDKAFEAQLDAIFRVTHSSNFNTSIQALMLIQQISAAKQYAAERYYRTLYESLLDPRLLTSSKQVLYLNLLYRSLKSDISVKRVKAFVKRLLQIISLHEPPFVCGVLCLIYELKAAFPSIAAMLDQPEETAGNDEEHFVDISEGADHEKVEASATAIDREQSLTYDGRKRNPEYCNADRSCLWELVPFLSHFHPTVAIYAARLVQQEKMDEKPDPSLHTLMHFLDRFVYRKAKVKATTRGISVMQPLAGAPDVDMLIKDRTAPRIEVPMNSESFWQRKKEEVAADEVFFHQYFAKAGKKKSRQEMRADKATRAVEESEGSEAENEIWKALVDSRPDIEGEEEEQDDVDLDDYLSDADDDEEDVDADVDIHDAPSDEEISQCGETPAEWTSNHGFHVAELEEDDTALLDSGDEVPDVVDLPYEGFNDSGDRGTRRALHPNNSESKHRKTLKSLPVFASAEDYAKLIGDNDEGDE